MATPQRLPIVNSDDGVWGDIIRQYIMKEHFNDDTDNAVNGGHQKITIRAGTATAGTAPIKLTSGTLLTTPEAGAVEFNGDNLYFTQTSSTTRKKVALYDDSSGATGDIYYRGSTGYFTRLGVGSNGNFLTLASGVPAWTSSIPSSSTVSLIDTNFTLQDDGDATKQMQFQLSGITTGTTRTLTVPDASTTLVGTDAAQTLTNKTISSGLFTGTSIAPTGGVFQLYNTADQVTNYERMRMGWSGNVFQMWTEQGGTGASRSIGIGVTANQLTLSSGSPKITMSTGTASGAVGVSITGTHGGTNLVQTGLSIANTISQSSTAGYTALLINPTESSTGSGTKLLQDWQVGGTSLTSMDNTGTISQTGTSAVYANYNLGSPTAANYERARFFWSSNIFTIDGSEAGGTGSQRSLRIQAQGKSMTIAGGSALYDFTGGTGGGVPAIRITGTNSASSGTAGGFSYIGTMNQSGTAGYTGILINVTETATGSGARLLADFQLGSSSKTQIDTTGTINLVGSSASLVDYNVGSPGAANYETGVFRYNSNVLEVGHIYGGTGASRQARFGTAATAGATMNRYIQMQSGTPFISYQWGGSTLAGNFVEVGNSGNSLLASSGTQTAMAILPAVNQSSTASYIGLLINATETAVGSGTNRLLLLQTGGSTKFSVNSDGTVTAQGGGANSFNVSNTITATAAGAVVGTSVSTSINPSATSSAEVRAFNMSAQPSGSQTLGTVQGAFFETRLLGSNSAGMFIGAKSQNVIPGNAQNFGTITTMVGLEALGLSESASSAITGTVTNVWGLNVSQSLRTNSSVTITNVVGGEFKSQSIGTGSNITVRIAPSSTYSLQLTDTSGGSNGGITFGTDTNLYRSAANTLKTDGALVIGSAGSASGSVVTTDGTQTLTNKTLTNPRINQIVDTNGLNILGLYPIASAVNQFYITNQSNTNWPTFGVDGADSNIGMTFAPKGNGSVRIYVPTGQTPTIDVGGPDTNLDLNFLPKGTGRVKAAGVTIPTISSTDTLTNKTLAAGSNTITGLGIANLGGITGTASATTYLRGDGTWSTVSSSGGDASTNTTTSVDGEVVLFNGTTGKSLKRATGTGIAKLTSGVLSTATAGTDYTTPTGAETLSNKTLILPGVSGSTYTQGKLVFDTDNDSLTFYNSDSNVSLQVGQEEWIRVLNNSGATIANGSAVYISGASGGYPTIALARADSVATAVGAGLATESIANNAVGFITTIGIVRGLDTSAFTAGQIVYISSTTAGGLTATVPSAPNIRYRVGIVAVSSSTVGTIHVTPTTAALGNGSANQVFGMNAAGTLQEVKTIVGASSNISVTHTANTITLDAGIKLTKVPKLPNTSDAERVVIGGAVSVVAGGYQTTITNGYQAATMASSPGLLGLTGTTMTSMVNVANGYYGPGWKDDAGTGSIGTYVSAPFSSNIWVSGSRYVEFITAHIDYSAIAQYGYRVWVDGHKKSDLPITTGMAASGSASSVKIDLGDTKPHLVRLDMSGMALESVYVEPAGVVWAANTGPRLFVLGCSLTGSIGGGFNTGFELGTWLPRFANMVGITDYWNGGEAGTGPNTTASSGNFKSYKTRATTQAIPSGADVIIIDIWFNDNNAGRTGAQIAADIGTTISTIQAGLPNAKIIVLGGFDPYAANTSAFTAIDAQVEPVCTAAGAAFISMVTGRVLGFNGALLAATGKWITNGNKSIYINSTDNTHPTDAGHEFIAYQMRNAWALIWGIADDTGSGVSGTSGNLTVASFADSAIITKAESVGANDNDTSLPTTSAVKSYTDTQVIQRSDITNRRTSLPTLFSVFTRYADSAASPSFFDSGQAAVSVAGTGTNTTQYLSGGRLRSTPTNSGAAAAYFRGQASVTIKRAGARFVFIPHSTNGGTLAIGVSNTAVVSGTIPALGIHLVVTPISWALQYSSTTNGALNTTGSGTFATPLLQDSLTEYEIEITVIGNTAYILLPDGTRTTADMSTANSYVGPHVFFEHYYNTANTDNEIAMIATWADTGIQHLPTAAGRPVQQIDAANIVYGNSGGGASDPIGIYWTDQATAYTMALRTANGRLIVGTPTAATDATTKSYVDTSTQAKFMTGTVSTASATAAKTVTLNSPWASYTPAAGDWFLLTFTNGMNVASATLSVNGSTALPIESPSGSTIAASTQIATANTALFYYDGSSYTLPGATSGSGGGGSGISRSVTVTSGSFTAGSAASTDYVYLIAGAHAVTLPSGNGNTNVYTFKNNYTANITITRAGSDTIEGSTSISIAPSASVDLISSSGSPSTWSVI